MKNTPAYHTLSQIALKCLWHRALTEVLNHNVLWTQTGPKLQNFFEHCALLSEKLGRSLFADNSTKS